MNAAQPAIRPPDHDRDAAEPRGDPPPGESNNLDGLDDVLFRAMLVGRYYSEQLLADGIRGSYSDLSFTTILIGFLASNVPLARWFQRYVRDANVESERLLLSKKIDSQALNAIRSKPYDPEAVAEASWTATALYVGQAANDLSVTEGYSKAGVFSFMAAYIYRCPQEQEKKLAAWRFNRINWSNAFLSYSYTNPELRFEVEMWGKIHHLTFGRGPVLWPNVYEGPPAPPDVTPLHLDNPSAADYLGRRGFAEALAVRLNRVWRECNRQEGAAESRSSFVLHLHGPWGSGKTSLLKLLRKELQPPRAPGEWEGAGAPARPRVGETFRESADADADLSREAMRWIVVEFNAWQHQRIAPPWWSLLDTVYRRSVRQLADGNLHGDRRRSWHVGARERWWRFSTARKDYLVTTVFSFVILTGLLYLLAQPRAAGDEGYWTLAKSGAALLSAVVGVWSTALLATRSLISGSSRSAQAFMEVAGDPMERIGNHFRDLVGWMGKPVVIFIDDLDRCQPKYVVDLLEGVQTLFSDPRVVYVIAADRRWLNTCFETAYSEFAAAVREPGRRLGSLFLEKAFELSVEVPRLSGEMKQVYWDYLVHGARGDIEQAIERESAEVQHDFVDAETEEQVFLRLRESTGDALRDQVRKGAAVRRLASRRVVASTEYFLKPFAPLLEPNPRAMKRLVNAYSVLRDTALLAGVDVLVDIKRRKQLVLWAIVSLRWPLLKDYLEHHPEAIDRVRQGRTRDGKKPLIDDASLQRLVESGEVLSVFEGGGTGAGLEAEAVCQIIGISAGQPAAASVA